MRLIFFNAKCNSFLTIINSFKWLIFMIFTLIFYPGPKVFHQNDNPDLFYGTAQKDNRKGD